MAWTHEQTRLREPTNRTAEVRAINGKNLERFSIDIPNPTGDICCLPVRVGDYRICIRSEARLAGRKLPQISDGNPRIIAASLAARDGRDKVPQDRNGQNYGDNAVKKNPDLHEQLAPRQIGRQRHGISPVDFAVEEYG
jgi:hypothetical protein